MQNFANLLLWSASKPPVSHIHPIQNLNIMIAFETYPMLESQQAAPVREQPLPGDVLRL